MLARVDATGANIAAVDAILIAEIGVDMTRFPTPAQLASWAKFAPGVNSSAGRTKGSGTTGHGNRYTARALGEAAVNAGRTDTFLGAEHYQRHVNTSSTRHNHVRQLEALGYRVTLDPAA